MPRPSSGSVVRIIASRQRAAIAALLDRGARRDARARAASRAHRRRACAGDGDRALLAYARRFDGLDGADGGAAPTRSRAAAREVPRDVRDGDRDGGPPHPPRRGKAGAARTWSIEPVRGVRDRAARAAAGPRRLLRARRAVSAPLLAADDRDSRAGGRRAGGRRRLPAAGRDDHVRRARGRRVAAVPARRARTPIAALAYGTATVPRVDKIVGPGNACVAAAKALVSFDCAIDFQPVRARSRSSRPPAGPTGSPRICSRRPSTIRTRAPSCSRRRAALARRRRARAASAQMPETGPARHATGAATAPSC